MFKQTRNLVKARQPLNFSLVGIMWPTIGIDEKIIQTCDHFMIIWQASAWNYTNYLPVLTNFFFKACLLYTGIL